MFFSRLKFELVSFLTSAFVYVLGTNQYQSKMKSKSFNLHLFYLSSFVLLVRNALQRIFSPCESGNSHGWTWSYLCGRQPGN